MREFLVCTQLVLVGIEATGSMPWFSKLMEELKAGTPSNIRRRSGRTTEQKHDRRTRDCCQPTGRKSLPYLDASTEQRDLRTLLLASSHQWVRMRMRVQHTLQSYRLMTATRRNSLSQHKANTCYRPCLFLAGHQAALSGLYPVFQKAIDDLTSRAENAFAPSSGTTLNDASRSRSGQRPSYRSVLGDPLRFVDGKAVASYIGLISVNAPAEAGSGSGSWEARRQRSGALSLGEVTTRWCDEIRSW